MKEKKSRRSFIKTSLAMGGAVTIAGPLMGADEKKGKEDIKELLKKERQKVAKAFSERVTERRVTLFKRLVKEHGKGILETVKKNTIEETKARFQKAKLEHRNLEGVKKYLWNGLDKEFEYKVVKDTPEHLEFKVTKCPIAEKFKKMNAGEIGFAFNCAYDYGFAEGLNPDIKFTRTKVLILGDNCCNHTYVLKKKKKG